MRRVRRPHLRAAGGTGRRRRHRFPNMLQYPARLLAVLRESLGGRRYVAVGDVDALLWEHAADLVAPVSER